MSEYLVIGQVLKPQGLKGEVKIRPITQDINRFAALKALFVKRGEAYDSLGITHVRIHDGFVYLTLAGTQSREAAEALRGELLYIDRAHAIALPEDMHFIVDLIGCRVRDDLGGEVGTLREVLQPGGSDVYVIDTPEGELMVPALKAVVLQIDTEAKCILVDAKRLAEMGVYA